MGSTEAWTLALRAADAVGDTPHGARECGGRGSGRELTVDDVQDELELRRRRGLLHTDMTCLGSAQDAADVISGGVWLYAFDTRSSFLYGLLNKKPTARLNWPDLLHHPFVHDPSPAPPVRGGVRPAYKQPAIRRQQPERNAPAPLDPKAAAAAAMADKDAAAVREARGDTGGAEGCMTTADRRRGAGAASATAAAAGGAGLTPPQARGVTGWQSSVAGGVRASQQAEQGQAAALRAVTAGGAAALAAAEELTLSSEGVFALLQVRACLSRPCILESCRALQHRTCRQVY